MTFYYSDPDFLFGIQNKSLINDSLTAWACIREEVDNFSNAYYKTYKNIRLDEYDFEYGIRSRIILAN